MVVTLNEYVRIRVYKSESRRYIVEDEEGELFRVIDGRCECHDQHLPPGFFDSGGSCEHERVVEFIELGHQRDDHDEDFFDDDY